MSLRLIRACCLMVVPVLSISLYAPVARAQGNSASCSIHNAAPSEAEAAFFKGDYRRAGTLAAAAYKADPADRRSRQLEIDSLIAEGKPDEADKLAEAWATAAPQDPYAILAVSEVRHARGEWLEAYALALKSIKVDPCLADAYEDIANFESLAGYRLTARKHLALAHQLAPKDDSITLNWIRSLPPAESVERLGDFIQATTALDPKSRDALQRSLHLEEALAEDKCQLSALHGPAVIPMVPIYGAAPGIESYGLEVAFNGHKRVLQIDTGATGVLLTHSAVTGLGLTKVVTAKVGGFGSEGPSGTTIETATTLQIGDFEFHNCVVESLNNFGVMGGSHLEGARLDTGQGLVSTDIFKRYAVTLDYIKHEIRLEPLPKLPNAVTSVSGLDALGGNNDLADWSQSDRYIAPEMKGWAKVYRNGHQLIAPAVLNRQIPALFMLDTGSFTNLVSERLANQVGKSQDSGMYSVGLSGVSKIGETGKFTLDFAGVRLPVKGMNTMKSLGFGGVSGFIGYPTLENLVLHIDYRDDLVLIEAPPQK